MDDTTEVAAAAPDVNASAVSAADDTTMEDAGALRLSAEAVAAKDATMEDADALRLSTETVEAVADATMEDAGTLRLPTETDEAAKDATMEDVEKSQPSAKTDEAVATEREAVNEANSHSTANAPKDDNVIPTSDDADKAAASVQDNKGEDHESEEDKGSEGARAEDKPNDESPTEDPDKETEESKKAEPAAENDTEGEKATKGDAPQLKNISSSDLVDVNSSEESTKNQQDDIQEDKDNAKTAENTSVEDSDAADATGSKDAAEVGEKEGEPAAAVSKASALFKSVFGESSSEDEDDEEFKGFEQPEDEQPPPVLEAPAGSDSDSPEPSKKKKKKKKRKEQADEPAPQDDDDAVGTGEATDFDKMLQTRKQKMRRRRKFGDDSVSTQADEMIASLTTNMYQAAEEDTEAFKESRPAIAKLKLLPQVVTILRGSHTHQAALDGEVLKAFSVWLKPLSNKSLASLKIRTALIGLIEQLPQAGIDREILKRTNIGKACNMLLHHKDETKENKDRLRKLLSTWARPVFGLHADYQKVDIEEKMKRDRQIYPERMRKRRRSSGGAAEEEKTLRPGDKGFIMRARVPQPVMRDYVKRPQSQVNAEDIEVSKKQKATKLQGLQRRHRESQLSSQKHKQHAQSINLSGGFAAK